MRQYEPVPVKRVVRGSDPLGVFWQVFYDWEWGGRKFSYGSSRVIESLIPEESHLEEISEAVHEAVDFMIASHCAQVDMISVADNEWAVKIVKRAANGLYVERTKTFGDFNEAIAFVKEHKYPVLLKTSFTMKENRND